MFRAASGAPPRGRRRRRGAPCPGRPRPPSVPPWRRGRLPSTRTGGADPRAARSDRRGRASARGVLAGGGPAPRPRPLRGGGGVNGARLGRTACATRATPPIPDALASAAMPGAPPVFSGAFVIVAVAWLVACSHGVRPPASRARRRRGRGAAHDPRRGAPQRGPRRRRGSRPWFTERGSASPRPSPAWASGPTPSRPSSSGVRRSRAGAARCRARPWARSSSGCRPAGRS